jgi:hypothetical protein
MMLMKLRLHSTPHLHRPLPKPTFNSVGFLSLSLSFFFFAVLEFELRALHLLGKYLPLEPCLQSLCSLS